MYTKSASIYICIEQIENGITHFRHQGRSHYASYPRGGIIWRFMVIHVNNHQKLHSPDSLYGQEDEQEIYRSK